MNNISKIRLVLGDQLNQNHSWFKRTDPHILYVMMEVRTETDYVVHHIQKILGIFSNMRAFADSLRNHGHLVHYIRIGDAENKQDFINNLIPLLQKFQVKYFEYLEPDEFRLKSYFENGLKQFNMLVKIYSTEHFYTNTSELSSFFQDKKTYLMESFYRYMRKKHNVLMSGNHPIGGKWNFDLENRKKLPDKQFIPQAKLFNHNVKTLYNEIISSQVKFLGYINESDFIWPIGRKEALELLEHFCIYLLPFFGTFQDAISSRDWSLFHSRISFALNLKIISPIEVVEMVEKYYVANPSLIAIQQAEGFIRQILGWREYIRGVYWAEMPVYSEMNYFQNKRKLPDFYWTGNTRMSCMKAAIKQTLDHAYAHHIQRLMVTGNFALLSGIEPKQVDFWYLGVYIDAFEWVELPNTRGMSQFADGGLLATKPYVSSANYLNKMGDHCSSCYYNHRLRVGEKACPFNSLYWNFFDEKRKLLERNPRVGMVYRTLDKMGAQDLKEVKVQASKYLENLSDI